MRRNPIATLTAATLALTLLTAGSVSAQLTDDFVEPERFPGIETGLILNAGSPGQINARIDSTLRDAHLRVGGRITDNQRRNGFFDSGAQPDRLGVVTTARTLATEREPDVVFISGGDSQTTAGFADRFINTIFVDLGEPVPCLDRDGRPDRSGECPGGAGALASNHLVVPFEVEDPAFLAGVVAASASPNSRLGIISGFDECDECNRYIQGFVRGATSVKPDIEVELAYLADDDERQAFGDRASAATFASAFIDVYEPDVLLPLTGDASVGMVEAACEAGILAIGTGIDVAGARRDLAQCVLASITKDVETAVRGTLYDITAGTLNSSVRAMTLEDGGVALTDDWRALPTLPLDTQGRFDAALEGLLAGTIESCPEACGEPLSNGGSDAGEPDAAEDPDAED